MRAINHALTGAIIGLVVGESILAAPLAVVSHFIGDAIPHHGTGEASLKTAWFRRAIYIDALLCFGLVVVLALAQPLHWQLAAVCAFLAAAPDFLSINHVIKARRNQKWKPNLYGKFAKGIQWFERPVGAAVEIAWFIAAAAILVPLLRL
jgi:hypothetical protein